MTTAEEYRTASTTLFDQAMVELDAGDLRQASEKFWGASAQALKSLAERRGWRHGSHREFYRIIRRLRNEMDVTEHTQQFAFASELHTNFYENWLDETDIRERVVHVRNFVNNMAEIRVDTDLN